MNPVGAKQEGEIRMATRNRLVKYLPVIGVISYRPFADRRPHAVDKPELPSKG